MIKNLKYITGILSVILIIFLSVEIKRLDNFSENKAVREFDLTSYIDNFWNNDLPSSIKNAPEITFLFDLLKEDPGRAFKDHSKILGISKTHYFLTQGKGVVKSVNDEDVTVEISNGTEVKIAVDFIFGNAVRDGSGKVNIDDFLNMTDFNNVSIEINKLVRNNVASFLKKSAVHGLELEFAGAMEINEDNTALSDIRIIPVSLNLDPGTTD